MSIDGDSGNAVEWVESREVFEGIIDIEDEIDEPR